MIYKGNRCDKHETVPVKSLDTTSVRGFLFILSLILHFTNQELNVKVKKKKVLKKRTCFNKSLSCQEPLNWVYYWCILKALGCNNLITSIWGHLPKMLVTVLVVFFDTFIFGVILYYLSLCTVLLYIYGKSYADPTTFFSLQTCHTLLISRTNSEKHMRLWEIYNPKPNSCML